MIIKERGNILTAKGIEVLCVASQPESNTKGLMHYVKLKYPKVFKSHLEHVMTGVPIGSSSMHWIDNSNILALLYTLQNYDTKVFCNYAAIEERINYIHEIYSDKIVAVSIPNIIADGNREHVDIVEYIINNIYGDDNDTSIIRVFK